MGYSWVMWWRVTASVKFAILVPLVSLPSPSFALPLPPAPTHPLICLLSHLLIHFSILPFTQLSSYPPDLCSPTLRIHGPTGERFSLESTGCTNIRLADLFLPWAFLITWARPRCWERTVSWIRDVWVLDVHCHQPQRHWAGCWACGENGWLGHWPIYLPTRA